jgi:hypothetical protein
MKPFERPNHRAPFRAGIALTAMMAYALSSASARRAGPATNAAAAVGIVAATVSAADNNDTTQTSTSTDVRTAPQSAKEVRG